VWMKKLISVSAIRLVMGLRAAGDDDAGEYSGWAEESSANVGRDSRDSIEYVYDGMACMVLLGVTHLRGKRRRRSLLVMSWKDGSASNGSGWEG
jgi:hypothetical protein